MARYREIRKIDKTKVRYMCIRENYYTRGNETDYSHLLGDLCNFCRDLTMDDLEEIVADILNHSDVDGICDRDGCTKDEIFGAVLWEIINECCTVLVKKDVPDVSDKAGTCK